MYSHSLVWLALSTKTTWLGSEKKQGLGMFSPPPVPRPLGIIRGTSCKHDRYVITLQSGYGKHATKLVYQNIQQTRQHLESLFWPPDSPISPTFPLPLAPIFFFSPKEKCGS